MKNKLLYLTKQSLYRKIKSKWFLIVNMILSVLIISLINIDSIINFFGGDFNKPIEVIVIDNTNESYDMLADTLNSNKSLINDIKKYEIKKYEKNIEDAKKEIKDTDNILIVLNNDDKNYMNAKIISNEYIDTIFYQTITNCINSTKQFNLLRKSNIDIEELEKINTPIKIERIYLEEDKNSKEENMNIIMNTIFPIIILPFFMLSIFLIQMIGAEINDEKSTRGMEIIISNVSPKTHFFSKIIAGNLFVFIQSLILFLSLTIGLIIRKNISTNSIINFGDFDLSKIIDTLTQVGIIDRLYIIIPISIILFILSFFAYSLLAGILSSMTTNLEDYQQLQSPIMIISVIGYYLAVMASLFNGSIFIKIMSYVPFISALLSPSLLIMGDITLIDVFISISLLCITIFILIKYGLKIYKVGILNYSSNKLWKKMFKAIKQK